MVPKVMFQLYGLVVSRVWNEGLQCCFCIILVIGGAIASSAERTMNQFEVYSKA